MTIKPINPYDNVTRNVIDHFRRGSHDVSDPEEVEVAKTLADLASSPVRRWTQAASSAAVEVVVESENDEQKQE